MHVHAAAVVHEEWLGHEGGRLAVFLGDVLDDVFVFQDVVGHVDQRRKAHVDFALAAGGDLVVLGLDLQAALDHGEHHFGAQIVQRVGRRHREVTFLVTQLVTKIGLLVAAGVPGAFHAVEIVVAGVLGLIIADVVEDEEFQLRAEIGGVGDAGLLHEVDGLAGHVARVARVVFLGKRVLDVADHRQGRVLAERIDERRLRNRHDEHVRLIDGLPAADAGAVKAQAFFKHRFVQRVGGDGEMLPETGEVHETQIDRLDFLLADQSQNFFRCHEQRPPYG